MNVIKKCFSILFCGDGCCCINDEFHSVHDSEGNAVWYLSTVKPIEFLEYYNTYCTKFNGIIEENMTLCISSDGIESFMTSYGSSNVSLPIDVFFKTDNIEEKYRSWNLQRLYNVLTKGKMNGMNNEGLTNIDDLSIIKIKIKNED